MQHKNFKILIQTIYRPDAKWKPLLLVVPLRLGLSDLNEAYVPGIKAALEIPQNIGIIGGRPNHALYFIGYAGKMDSPKTVP